MVEEEAVLGEEVIQGGQICQIFLTPSSTASGRSCLVSHLSEPPPSLSLGMECRRLPEYRRAFLGASPSGAPGCALHGAASRANLCFPLAQHLATVLKFLVLVSVLPAPESWGVTYLHLDSRAGSARLTGFPGL